MELSIKNDFEYDEIFSNEEACLNYLLQKKWQGKPKCNGCGNNKDNYYLVTRKTYKCSSCRKQFSLTQGTIFHSSKLPLCKWFKAIYLFIVHEGIASTKLAKRIGVQQRTAWLMLQKIRETMKDENLNGVLSGIVEVDEAYLGSKPGRDLRLRKRMNEHKLKGHKREYEHLKAVFGIIDRYSKKIVLRKLGWNRNCLTNEKAETLLKKHVNTISTINTDEHFGYNRLEKHFHSHHIIQKHRMVKRTSRTGKTYDTWQTSYVDGKKHVNGIENVWMHLQKKEKGTYFHFSYKHTQRYLDEFSFLWNRKDFEPGKIMDELFSNAMNMSLNYTDLIKWNHEEQTKPWAA